MANDVIRPIDAAPLIADGWVLEKHGVSNVIIGRKSLADVPAIDPESLRPKGKWRLNKDGSGTCSECHRTRNDVWDMDNWDNFCSHCGADMRGRADDGK